MKIPQFALGNLADPKYFTGPLRLPSDLNKETLLGILNSMQLIRIVEQTIADLVSTKQVKCPCHLGVGQEAISVGVAQNLQKSDMVYGTHRSHCQYLAMQGDVYQLLAEVFGKESGCAGGIGGSQHLIDSENGFCGSVPIVGGTIPIAAGAALASKILKKEGIAVCFFGDGACEEGVFHETLNLASIQKLPILFVCENNLFASHLDIKLRQPSDSLARFAQAHSINYEVVDGNDVFAVTDAARSLISDIKRGNGPGFLEAVTYRWLGHVGANVDIDVGVRRSLEELNMWKKRDPIRRMADALIEQKIITPTEFQQEEERVRVDVGAKLEKAKSAPFPSPDKLLYKVYASE